MGNGEQPQISSAQVALATVNMACRIPSVRWLRRDKSVTTPTTPASDRFKLNREFCEQSINTSLKCTPPGWGFSSVVRKALGSVSSSLRCAEAADFTHFRSHLAPGLAWQSAVSWAGVLSWC